LRKFLTRREKSMKNVEFKVSGKKLTIEIDLSKNFGPSKSGKTTIVASTEGNETIPNTGGIIVGLNAYVKR